MEQDDQRRKRCKVARVKKFRLQKYQKNANEEKIVQVSDLNKEKDAIMQERSQIKMLLIKANFICKIDSSIEEEEKDEVGGKRKKNAAGDQP